MNRTELAEVVAARTGLDRKQSEAAVHAVTTAIMDEVRSGEKVSIFGFGSFVPKTRPAGTRRNPRTQQAVKVAASKNVGFRPSTAFKEALNTKGRSTKKAAAATKASTKSASKSAPAKGTAARSATAKATAKAATAAKSTASRATKAAAGTAGKVAAAAKGSRKR